MRFLASIVLKDQKVVQSFGYKNYLPLGKLAATLQNLKRWEVEEIVIKNLDKTDDSLNNICALLKDSFITTPITYGGFIRSRSDMKKLLDSGVDRFCFDNSVVDAQLNCSLHEDLAGFTGRQSMVANLNILLNNRNELQIYDYLSKSIHGALTNDFLKTLALNFSEVIFNDVQADGERRKFNVEIIRQLKKYYLTDGLSYLVSGGVGFDDTPKVYRDFDFIDGVVLGNSLYRHENSYKNWTSQNG